MKNAKYLYLSLHYFLLALFFLLLVYQSYSLVILFRPREPWLLGDRFFFSLWLFCWLRFILSIFFFLVHREYLAIPPSTFFSPIFSMVKAHMRKSFVSLEKISLSLFTLFHFLWKRRGSNHILLFLIFFPRILLPLALLWDFFFTSPLSLYHFYGSFPLLLFPFFFSYSLSLHKKILEAQILSILSLFHRIPQGDDFVYSWTKESLKEGYGEEDKERFITLLHGLGEAFGEVDDFFSLRKKYSIPLNLFLSFFYVILWFFFSFAFSSADFPYSCRYFNGF